MIKKLTATGLVVEYNPFHNGHIHHIQETQKITDNDVLIAIMSPHFVQRGEPAFIDKWSRTKAALDKGIDIVIELPTYYALQSADYFASAAIQLLSLMKVSDLVYGVENLDLVVPTFNKEAFESGASYAASFEHDLASPNNNLALAYEKAIANSEIRTHRIQRTNSYNSLEIDTKIASASAIRNAHKEGHTTQHTSPMTFKTTFDLSEYESIIKYAIASQSTDELKNYLLVDEGIEHLLKKHFHKPLDDFINACTSSRYTHSRITRTLMNIILKNRKDTPASLEQVRILGFTNKGQEYLKQCKKDDVPMTPSFRNYVNKDLELLATTVYSLVKDQMIQDQLRQNEISNLIRK